MMKITKEMDDVYQNFRVDKSFFIKKFKEEGEIKNIYQCFYDKLIEDDGGLKDYSYLKFCKYCDILDNTFDDGYVNLKEGRVELVFLEKMIEVPVYDIEREKIWIE